MHRETSVRPMLLLFHVVPWIFRFLFFLGLCCIRTIFARFLSLTKFSRAG